MEISFRISFNIFIFFLLSTKFASGQNQIDYGQRESGYTIIENDTIPWVFLDDILVLEKPTFSNPDARKKYYILRHKVIKVYPYAKGVGQRLDTLNQKLSMENKRVKRKKLTRKYYKFLKKRFEPELHKLTVSEGQILSKLIFRETEMTVFEIIKSYRNRFNAIIWGITANWWNISLRNKYLPEVHEEDALIERILLRAFANNDLEPRKYYYKSS